MNVVWLTQVPQGRAFYVIKQDRGDGLVTISVHAELSSFSLQQKRKLLGATHVTLDRLTRSPFTT